jgi:hypothetical protein
MGAGYTQFLDATTKRPKTALYAGRRDDFKPIQVAFRLTAKAACDYTE